MIVRNESKIICRCLNSSKGIVDSVFVVDTGSEDNTIEIINNWAKDTGIHTIVVERPWVNFGHNREESYKLCREYIPESTHVILIDADMLLVNKGFEKSSLTKDFYKLMQYNDVLEYRNIRIVSTKFDWKCVGVTHEYWEPNGKAVGYNLDTLIIDDRGDGGCKDDKFERDYRLLNDALEKDDIPDQLRARYYFYLAQTCYALGRKDECITYYNKRIGFGGWEQEVWYSMYQIGRVLYDMDKVPQAMGHLIKAYNYRPSRPETLYTLSHICRAKGQYFMAFMYASQGAATKKSTDSLFVNTAVSDYLLDQEISISGYYCRDVIPSAFNIGKEKCEELLNRDDIPKESVELAKANYRFYTQ